MSMNDTTAVEPNYEEIAAELRAGIREMKKKLAEVLEPETPFKFRRKKRNIVIYKCTDVFDIELCKCTNSDAALLILQCLYTAHNIKAGSDLEITK